MAKQLGGAVKKRFQKARAKKRFEQCVAAALGQFLEMLESSGESAPGSRYDIVGKAAGDPELAQELMKVFSAEPVDPAVIQSVFERQGLDPRQWKPYIWQLAVNQLHTTFLAEAAVDAELVFLFEAGERRRERGPDLQSSSRDEESPRVSYLRQLARECRILPLIRLTSQYDDKQEVTLDQVLIHLDTTTALESSKGQGPLSGDDMAEQIRASQK